jgi:hypothetical protein
MHSFGHAEGIFIAFQVFVWDSNYNRIYLFPENTLSRILDKEVREESQA